MRIYVSGSLAYDRIMTFPGKFVDHILPEKLHILNVSFMVEGLDERFGGTGGNIVYSLSLLGEKPTLLSAAGRDFEPYAERLKSLGLTLDGVRVIHEELTAGAYITTDKSDNQITGFNPGAMKHSCNHHIDRTVAGGALGIVSPGNLGDMLAFPATFKELNIPYLFDPGQQIPVLSGEQMTGAISGALALVSNDYELEMILRATKLTEKELLSRCEYLITTLGEKGCRILEQDKSTVVPCCQVDAVVDPTGAGDAFRAGFLKGLVLGKSPVECARMGNTAAAFCVEVQGTQEFCYNEEAYWLRYSANYGRPE